MSGYAVDPSYLAANNLTASQFTLNESAGIADGPAPVPEPSGLALVGSFLAGLAVVRRVRRRS